MLSLVFGLRLFLLQRSARLCLPLVLGLLWLPFLEGSGSPPIRNLVVVGGGSIDEGIYHEFLSLSPSPDPRVLVIPYASELEDIAARGEAMTALFHSLGVSEVEVLDLTRRQEARAAIDASEAIWIPGGIQLRLMRALEDAGVVDAIRSRASDGVPIGGTSAGAAVMSHLMLASGMESPRMSHGLGLWPEVVVDQHFSERSRLPRLEAVIRDFPAHLGVGIDESTAVVVQGSSLRVMGAGSVTLVRATGSPGSNPVLQYEILAAGDSRTFDEDPQEDPLAGLTLHDWLFNDRAGTTFSQTLNRVRPSIRWSGNLDNSSATGQGTFRIRRNGGGLNRRADVSDVLRFDQLEMRVEIAGWDLRQVSGTLPSIRFDLMNGKAADLPSEVTAGFRLDRLSNGQVTLQAIANGTALPGAVQSEAVPLFDSLLTDKLTVAVVYDRYRDRYQVRYRLNEDDWQEFFSGNTSGVREALSFRMYVNGDFDGNGNSFFDLGRFSVSTAPGPLAGRNIPRGESHFVHLFGGTNVTVPVWTYLPPDAPENPPVVIVCHGMGRTARSHRNSWIPHADRFGFLLVAPEFTDESFPGSRTYNLGNMYSSSGALNPQETWSFNVIEEVFDEVVYRTGSDRTSYHIYGHSAGSQFVHRMLLFMPSLRVDKVVMANAGWYTLPDHTVDYPHGLRSSHFSLPILLQRLSESHLVLLGTEDTDTTDPSLSTHPASQAQGPHRFARGNTFYNAAELQTVVRGTPFGWSLGYAPGIAHSNAGIAPFAANWLFSNWSGRGGMFYNAPEELFGYDFSSGLPAETNPDAAWSDQSIVPGFSVLFSNTGTPESYRVGNTSAPGAVQHWRAHDTSTAGILGGRPSAAIGDVHYGLRLTNNTDETLYGFTIEYEGAQFYTRNSGVHNALHVAWRLGTPGDLAEGSWQDIPALTFHAPQPGNGNGSGFHLDPHAPSNRALLGPVEVTGLAWLPGTDLWIRWTQPHQPGGDHGLGIDNVAFTAIASPPDFPAPIAPLRLTQGSGNGWRISLPAFHPGYLYQLQTSEDLLEWTNLGDGMIAESSPPQWELEADEAAKRFYRVLRVRP